MARRPRRNCKKPYARLGLLAQAKDGVKSKAEVNGFNRLLQQRSLKDIFDQHLTSICKLWFFHLRSIARIRDCLSTTDTETLVHAFITSRLDSCNSLLYGLPKFLTDRLQYVQHSAARLITRSRKYDPMKKIRLF